MDRGHDELEEPADTSEERLVQVLDRLCPMLLPG